MIEYRDSADGLAAQQLSGFFEGWPKGPTPQTHLRLLSESDEVVIAVDSPSGQVVGFITGITDNVLAAYIPFLEVRREFRGQGIGSELVRRLLSRLERLYMTDVICDPEVQPFYESLGFTRAFGASVRRYENQQGKK